MIKIGTQYVQRTYIGSLIVQKIYVGSQLIYDINLKTLDQTVAYTNANIPTEFKNNYILDQTVAYTNANIPTEFSE